MSRLLPLLAALLVLSACDFGGPDAVRLPEASVRVEVPPFVVFDRSTNLAVTVTNTTDRTLYLADARAHLWDDRAPGTPERFDLVGITRGDWNGPPPLAIAPGEQAEVTAAVNLRNGVWARALPLDGAYRVGLVLADSPDGLSAEAFDAADVTFSAPFELLFRWDDGRVFGG